MLKAELKYTFAYYYWTNAEWFSRTPESVCHQARLNLLALFSTAGGGGKQVWDNLVFPDFIINLQVT